MSISTDFDPVMYLEKIQKSFSSTYRNRVTYENFIYPIVLNLIHDNALSSGQKQWIANKRSLYNTKRKQAIPDILYTTLEELILLLGYDWKLYARVYILIQK